MTKNWTYEEFERAVNAAWSAFSSTLLLHGMTKNQLIEFNDLVDYAEVYSSVDNAFRKVTEQGEINETMAD